MQNGILESEKIKPLTTLILDDESASIETLKIELKLYCPEISIIGTALDPIDGLKKIKNLKPDLIFLDIVFGSMSGFNLLDKISNRKFDVIFVTAHQEYALKALQYGASGYLLKPVRQKELKETIKRIHSAKHQDDYKRPNL